MISKANRYIQFFVEFYKRERRQMLFILFLTVVTILVKTTYPILLKRAVDSLMGSYSYWPIVLFALFALFHEVIVDSLPCFRAAMNTKHGSNIRESYFAKLLGKSREALNSKKQGDLLTRLTDDIDGTGWQKLSWFSCSGIMRPVEATLILIFTLSVMLYYSPILTAVSFLPIPILVFIISRVQYGMVRYANESQESISYCNEILDSTLSGIRILKTTNSEQSQLKSYNQALATRIEKESRLLYYNQLLLLLSSVLQNIGKIVVIFFGGYLAIKGHLEITTLLIFVMYIDRLIEPIWTFSFFYATSKQINQYVDRLLELSALADRVPSKITSNLEPLIKACDLSYSYTESGRQFAVHNLNFEIHKGEIVGIIGAVGAGKSTLLSLLSHELTPSKGELTIDSSLRIGRVFQENLLFSMSILENLSLGKDFLMADIETALRASCFVLDEVAFPDGLATKISESGRSLSGGQRQRLTLARALLNHPDILLLDDVSSALDPETEMELWKNLKREYPHLTIVIATHRQYSAQFCDRLLVIEKGEIVDSGHHDELCLRSPYYQKLMQL